MAEREIQLEKSRDVLDDVDSCYSSASEEDLYEEFTGEELYEEMSFNNSSPQHNNNNNNSLYISMNWGRRG